MQLTSPDEVKAGTSQTKLTGTLSTSAAPQSDMLSLTFSFSTLVASYFYKQYTTEIDF